MAAVGSYCLLGAIYGDTLRVAKLGDSRAILARRVVGGGVAVAERLSADHDEASEEVRREFTTLQLDDKQIMMHTRSAWRVKGIVQAEKWQMRISIMGNDPTDHRALLRAMQAPGQAALFPPETQPLVPPLLQRV